MTLEEQVFSQTVIDKNRLIAYGFVPQGDVLVYTHDLEGENLRIVLTCSGMLTGRIMDLSLNEEYTNFRMNGATGYSAEIRARFEALLVDIREKCCEQLLFHTGQARRVTKWIRGEYGVQPEFLWDKLPDYAAFRRKKDGKWFAVIGTTARCKVDHASASVQTVEIINVRVDKTQIEKLLATPGLYPAFHMNKKSWVSIIFEDILMDDAIIRRVKESFERR